MAATACAYGYQGAPPPLVPVPAMPASQKVLLPDTFVDVVDGAVQQQPPEPAPAQEPPPPPPLPRPAKVPPSTLSLQLALCTEGLGSESSGDIDLGDLADDVSNDGDDDAAAVDVRLTLPCKRQHRARSARPAFPPPISLIGAGGKPWMYLRAQRGDGRLVLRELIIPSRELLHAHREDGRFKLQIAQPQPDEEPAQTQPDQDPADANGMAPDNKRKHGNELVVEGFRSEV